MFFFLAKSLTLLAQPTHSIRIEMPTVDVPSTECEPPSVSPSPYSIASATLHRAAERSWDDGVGVGVPSASDPVPSVQEAESVPPVHVAIRPISPLLATVGSEYVEDSEYDSVEPVTVSNAAVAAVVSGSEIDRPVADAEKVVECLSPSTSTEDVVVEPTAVDSSSDLHRGLSSIESGLSAIDALLALDTLKLNASVLQPLSVVSEQVNHVDNALVAGGPDLVSFQAVDPTSVCVTDDAIPPAAAPKSDDVIGRTPSALE